MNRIDQLYARLRGRGDGKPGAAMNFYLTAGHPTMEATGRAIDALARAGTDVIELGIPFSDPVADGPTIQQASAEALAAGATVSGVIELAAGARRRNPDLAIVLFGAYNPILRMGEARFAQAAAEAGVDGLLVADLPPEAAGALRAEAARHGLATVFLAAPTTTPERARVIADASGGFIYYISVRGVTGARAALPPDLEDSVRRLKGLTDKPVAVGFGVAEPDQARSIARFADGVVVGSALVRLIGASAGKADFEERVEQYAREMVEAVQHG